MDSVGGFCFARAARKHKGRAKTLSGPSAGLGPSGARGCDSLTALLPACEIQHTRSVTAVSGRAFARDSWVTCWLAKIYWAGPFLRLSEACTTLAALFPSRRLYVFETLATPGRGSATILFESILISANTHGSKVGGHPATERPGGFCGKHFTVCERFYHPRGLFLSGTAHVPGRYQEAGLWHQASVVGRQALASSGQDLLRTRELGHATSPSVPHGVMR